MIARPLTRQTVSALTGAALSVALAASVLLSTVPARAEEDVPFDTKILRGLLESLGLKKDGEPINYQERAPLVIPPTTALPPPEKSDAVIANNPAWPKDPDVERKKLEAARERANAHVSADEQIRNEARPLRPDELTPGPKPRGMRRAGKGDLTAGTFSESNQRVSPSELGYNGGLFNNMFGRRDDDVGKFTGEPARTSLTEPPPGYQTPSADQPYGLSARTTAPKATDYFTEHGTDTSK